MLVVTTTDVEKLYNALKDLDGPTGITHAARRSLNTSAIATRNEWEKQGRKSMHVRQGIKRGMGGWTFGKRNHRYVKARARKSINQMQSVAGNKLRYMEMQERGFGKFRAKGLMIPEDFSRIAIDRKRLVRRKHHRKGGPMTFPKKRYRYRGGKNYTRARGVLNVRKGRIARGLGAGYENSKKRYVAAVMREARASGANHVFLDWGNGSRGIYMVKGDRLIEQHKVWDMQRRHTRTRPNRMLKRTLRRLEPYFPTYHRSGLEAQIRFVLNKRRLRVRGPNILKDLAELQTS